MVIIVRMISRMRRKRQDLMFSRKDVLRSTIYFASNPTTQMMVDQSDVENLFNSWKRLYFFKQTTFMSIAVFNIIGWRYVCRKNKIFGLTQRFSLPALAARIWLIPNMAFGSSCTSTCNSSIQQIFGAVKI